MQKDLKFYRSEDIAKILDVNVMTVYRYIKAGKIKALKIGKEYRIQDTDFQSFIQNKTLGLSDVNYPNEKLKIVKPLLKWVGGKRQLLPNLFSRLPVDYKKYYEPFFGGGALFFALSPANAVISDLNPELINVYISIRDDVESVIGHLKKYKNDEDSFYEARKKDWLKMKPSQAAARTIYLNKTCFNGLYRVNKKGGFNVPFGKYKNPKIVDAENLRLVSEFLKKTKIKCDDYLKVLKNAKPKDLIFLDPPYLPISEFSDFKRYTKEQFHLEDHKKLAAEIQRLDRLGCYIILTNSNSPLVYDLYRGFNIEVIKTRRNINSKANRRSGEDIIVTNF